MGMGGGGGIPTTQQIVSVNAPLGINLGELFVYPMCMNKLKGCAFYLLVVGMKCSC